LYLARDCHDGQDWADWFAAAQDLMYMPESSAEQIAIVTDVASRSVASPVEN
jgi:hypothetical protein